MSRLRMSLVFAIAGVALCEASAASAQVLGTFRWQFAPYCNVVTVLIEQKGAVFELTGTDDGCNGAAPAATANGSAHVDIGGVAGGSITLVRPDGFVITNRISITPATLSGTWKDDWGNSGTLVHNPPSPAAGAQRPLVMRGDLTVYFTAIGAGHYASASMAFPQRLPSKPAAPPANIIPAGGAPTARRQRFHNRAGMGRHFRTRPSLSMLSKDWATRSSSCAICRTSQRVANTLFWPANRRWRVSCAPALECRHLWGKTDWTRWVSRLTCTFPS